jgi:mRNA turnover protein 4
MHSSARLFFGRGALMAKALGTTPEEEHRPGLAPLARVSDNFTIDLTIEANFSVAQQIKGQVGLLFTDTEPQEVIEWFKDFHQPDFARSGNRASRTVILPAGPVMQHHSDPPEPFPHNEEPQLRKLGLSTVMRKGVPTLENPHQLCEQGKVLTAEQAQLLKLIGEKMVEFRVGLRVRWDSTTGEVEDVTDPGVKLDVDAGDEEAELSAEEDEAISE